MIKNLIAIAFIYGCCCIAWMVLGGTVVQRTHQQDRTLSAAVGSLWGGEQIQPAPTLQRIRQVEDTVTREQDGETVTETLTRTEYDPIALAGTTLDVDLALEHRRKGLVWYPTYHVGLDGRYRLINDTEETATYRFTYRFPQEATVFDNVQLVVDGEALTDATVDGGTWVHTVASVSGATASASASRRSATLPSR